jgi:hypothetical protein
MDPQLLNDNESIGQNAAIRKHREQVLNSQGLHDMQCKWLPDEKETYKPKLTIRRHSLTGPLNFCT